MVNITETKVQQVIAEIEKYMRQFSGYYSDWYVGITEDPRKRLFEDHQVKEKGDLWIYQDCGSESNAREVEEYFLKKGCDGGTGGGDYKTTYAYAYKKNPHTNP